MELTAILSSFSWHMTSCKKAFGAEKNNLEGTKRLFRQRKKCDLGRISWHMTSGKKAFGVEQRRVSGEQKGSLPA